MEAAPSQRNSSGSVEPDWIETVVVEAKPWPWSAGTSDSADCPTNFGPGVRCCCFAIGRPRIVGGVCDNAEAAYENARLMGQDLVSRVCE